MGILDEITTVVEDPGPWSVLVYGPEGCRKTVFSARAKNVLMLDCEKSRRSLLNHPELLSVPLIKVKSLAQAQAVLEACIKNNDPRIKEIDTVCIDTVNELQEHDMGLIMKKLPAERDKDLPSQAEFNRNNRRIGRWIRDFQSLTDKNLILCAHTREEKDDEGQTVLIRPGTSPRLAETCARLVDGVFYMSYTVDSKGDEKSWTMSTVATRRIKGKSRFGNLPALINNPTFSMIEDAAEIQRKTALDALTQKETN